jgi:2'-5' RNA ligase
MTQTAHVRTFVAVDLVPEVRTAILRLKADLARVRSEVRWVRDEALHATIKFLGSVPGERLGDVRDAVARAAASVASFSARVRGLGAFPSIKRPRVLWVGLEAPALGKLAEEVEGALLPLGFAADERPFHSHVTLGRVSGQRGWTSVEAILKAHWTDDFGTSPVDHVTGYRSDLRPGGAVYTILWTIGLADSRRGEIHGLG